MTNDDRKPWSLLQSHLWTARGVIERRLATSNVEEALMKLDNRCLELPSGESCVSLYARGGKIKAGVISDEPKSP